MPNWLSRRAADQPEAPALIAGMDARWSFAELAARAGAVAQRLAKAGIGPGDHVAVLLTNGPCYVEVVHALTRLGAILIPLNLRLTPAEIAWQIEFAHARLLVYDATTAEAAGEIADLCPAVPRLALDERYDPVADATIARGDARIDLAAVQCIMFTSGTTGRPKGALLTYGNHWWSAIGSALNLGLQAHDHWLACLPLFHIGGLSILMRSVIYGIPVVFPEAAGRPARGFDPDAVNRTIAAEGVTIISVVSTMLQRMLEAQGNRPYPPALRCVLLGGGPAPRALLEECARRGVPVVQSYGLTESASQVATLAPADALRKLGSAGRPLLPNELRIAPMQEDEGAPDARVSDRGTQRELGRLRTDQDGRAENAAIQAPDIEGEILVRGPSITPGYLPPDGDLAAPQSAVDADGWLHTGDLGYLDREGYLYVLDRRADLIISGGENIYPAEVEAILLSHPAIAEAAVYGLQDERWGQRVAAAVVPRPDATLDQAELIAFSRARLAGYKVPTSLRIVPALPRNAAGKLLRRELREEQAT